MGLGAIGIVQRRFPTPFPIPARAADLAGLGGADATSALAVDLGGLAGELAPDLSGLAQLFLARYRTPPQKELILQLYHEVAGVGVCINGRQFLGNTPTVVAGPDSRMKFGLVGMGDMVHTFHLHGHRWIIPGPHGTTPGQQQFSPQDTPVSQFEGITP